jgi:hypothetical protein
MELTISIIGASVAVLVSLIGAWLSNYNTIKLQTRKLKEQYYLDFVSNLHDLCEFNTNESLASYLKARDILITVASAKVVRKIFDYEKLGIGESDTHDEYLTIMMKAIREDLRVGNRKLPNIFFKKA